MDNWRLLIHPDLPGFTQMAMDEALYQLAESDRKPVLRFYTWAKPTLSLGFFQRYKRVVSESFIVHNNIDVVRRITGGRAVLHQFEVTYALAAPLTNRFASQSLQETYRLISQALNRALESMGVRQAQFHKETGSASQESRMPQCFVALSPFEIAKDTRKIIGSAQKRSRDRFLQHGSILLDFEPYLQNGCILQPDVNIAKKVAPLNQLLSRNVPLEEVVDHFKCAFEQQFSIRTEPSEFMDQEKELVRSLEAVYKNENWTRNACR